MTSASRSPATPPADAARSRLPPREQRALLDRIIARCALAREAPRAESRVAAAPVVVFDLDGTLMDNRPRTSAILRELAVEWEAKHPELAGRLAGADPDALVYLLTDSLAQLGVTEGARVGEAEEFWKSRFFKDDHLVHDVEVPGAVAFARACYAAGAILVYLTGRDLPLMGLGTFRSLRDLGFPIGVPGTEVVLKPDALMPDEAFKRTMAPALARVGDVVAAFDNEPGNCNVFIEAYPTCESVLLDTQHMPGAPPLDPRVAVIVDFR